jgi:hypothetical protein
MKRENSCYYPEQMKMILNKRVLMSLAVTAVLGAIVSDGYSAEEKFDLKLKLKKGQKLGLRMVTNQKMSQTVMGQEQNMNQMMAVGMSFEVLDVDAEADMSIKTAYQAIHARMEGPMGVLEYDSTKPAEPAAGNPMAAMYGAMLGSSVVLKISPKGGVLGIEGIDKMIEKMADKMATDEAMKQQMKESMKNFINEEKMKEMSGTMVATLPENPVGIGQTWTNKISVPVGFPMEIEATNTLAEHKDGVFTIRTNAKFDSGNEPKPVEMGPMKMTMKMKGEQKGTIQIDAATGWIISRKTDMKFTGQFMAEANEQMPQGMTVPMTIESVITVEPMAVK